MSQTDWADTPKFTPPGIRTRNGRQGDVQQLSRRAATFFEQVEDLQSERDRFRHLLDTANARIEQFQSAETRLLSELEGERAKTAAAKAEAEQARADRVALETTLSAVINLATDALPR